MPRVTTPMYQCSRCERYMPASERASFRGRILSDTVNVEFNEDLCQTCVPEITNGKQTRPVRRRSPRVKQATGAPSAHDEVVEHRKAS